MDIICKETDREREREKEKRGKGREMKKEGEQVRVDGVPPEQTLNRRPSGSHTWARQKDPISRSHQPSLVLPQAH